LRKSESASNINRIEKQNKREEDVKQTEKEPESSPPLAKRKSGILPIIIPTASKEGDSSPTKRRTHREVIISQTR